MRICKYVTAGISMALCHVWCCVLYPIVFVSLWAQLRGEPILSSWECRRDYVGWAENDRGVSYVFGTEAQRAVDVIWRPIWWQFKGTLIHIILDLDT